MSAIKRQGDILLVPVSEAPEGLREIPRRNGAIVLAEGEQTGHLHAIESTDATFLAADLDEMAERFLAVESEVALVHPEHDTVTLEPGTYRVERQRSYTQAGGIELVAD